MYIFVYCATTFGDVHGTGTDVNDCPSWTSFQGSPGRDLAEAAVAASQGNPLFRLVHSRTYGNGSDLNAGFWMARPRPRTAADFMARYPCLTSHVIAESLGSCTPTAAAMVIMDAAYRYPNRSDWVRICYACDPVKALRNAIKMRHRHKGEMADYRIARAIVDQAIVTGQEPLFQSWPEMDSAEWAARADTAVSSRFPLGTQL